MKAEQQLADWSADWVRDGVVSAEQRKAILARHPVPAGGGQKFLAIVAGIGGALFATGISLIVKSNWAELGDWVKITGLVGLLVGFNALGWRLKMEPGSYPKTGDACLMAAAVFFLLGIALVSQIFHLDIRPANMVLLWWTGIAVQPWLARARGAQFLSAAAAVIWLFMELGSRDSWLGLVAAGQYTHHSEFAFFATGLPVGLTLLFFGLGLRGGRFDLFAGLHEKLGWLLACASLYALGFTWTTHRWMMHTLAPVRLEPVGVLGLLAAVGAAWTWLRNYSGLKAVGLWLLPALAPVAAHLLGLDLGDSGWLWGGMSCVALFVLNLGMIREGLAAGRAGWINLGMAFIALNIITRYFLLFGTLLEGGVFFAVTGLLVLGLGWWLERQRRALVGQARQEAAS